MSPFFIIVPEHGGTLAAETASSIGAFGRRAVLVEFQYGLILPGSEMSMPRDPEQYSVRT